MVAVCWPGPEVSERHMKVKLDSGTLLLVICIIGKRRSCRFRSRRLAGLLDKHRSVEGWVGGIRVPGEKVKGKRNSEPAKSTALLDRNPPLLSWKGRNLLP